ncbi:hypothetical protein VZT92_022913 [Zoarces viviparus]|uniref:BED-type domain-containing protein n=1 Tax=Zoarces viviparus TaxID=48416 RepID=A0AAW1E4K0_ZOAVI
MAPARKRRVSPVRKHFELISHNKVKCLLCSREPVYNNNTSSMLRHDRALHGNKETNPGGPSSGEKNDVDEALVNMEDSQPFTIVEDKGFRKLVKAFNPTYVLPTRQEDSGLLQEQHHCKGEADTGAGANGPAGTEADSREASQPVTQGSKLWHRFDTTVLQTTTRNDTADATVEVQSTVEKLIFLNKN